MSDGRIGRTSACCNCHEVARLALLFGDRMLTHGPRQGDEVLRYLFPAILMVAALLVLFAGALGDLHSWPHWQDALVSVVGKPMSEAPPPSASPQATAPSTASIPATSITPGDAALRQEHDTLRAQVNSLQGDVAGATQQLASLHAGEAQEQQQLDALTKQRHDLEASLARLKAQQRDASAATGPRSSAVSESARPTSRTITAPNRESTPPPPSPSTTLATAQNALMRGRPDEARQQLALAETQLVFRPVTPDQPLATSGNPAATDVREAIRWLDVGNTAQALQDVNLALTDAQAQSGNNGVSAAAPVPLSPGYYTYRPQPVPYSDAGWR
jgi:hypothetical protein